MKLPISIFPNVTEYTKANWTGYLKPAKVHLDSYSITEACKKTTTITQRPDGAIVMKKKPHETFEGGDFNIGGCSFTVSGIPANSAMVIIHEAIKDAGDWKTKWDKGSAFNEFRSAGTGTRLDSWSDALKNLVIVSRLTETLSGTQTFTFQYGYEGYHTIYFAFFDADRLDACLTGNHLKPISVGDKLGLVYWDGDHSIGGNYIDCRNVAGDKAYTLNIDASYFNYYHNGNYIKLLDKAGTVNISDLLGAKDITVSAIRGTEFQKHLFHVI